jgi:methenyltetrahydromethanopterin cyclohydrolase
VDIHLNQRAFELALDAHSLGSQLRIGGRQEASGPLILDFGLNVKGGLEAGVRLAEICLAGLAQVNLVSANSAVWEGAAIQVTTDHPVLACIASQYAGWKLESGKFFAMGSGPMRAAAAKEEVFKSIAFQERPDVAVGVLESGRMPPAEICERIAADCRVHPSQLVLCVAPTASQAGTIQVVARSVETCLHKLHEMGFELSRVESAYGTAPLPPVANDDLAGIGRTNDAILYGGQVTLWVRGDDASLAAIGPQIPSSASADFGEPFSSIFKRYDCDFYKIDRHLFSPAVVTLCNLDSGRTFSFGQTSPGIIRQSFLV